MVRTEEWAQGSVPRGGSRKHSSDLAFYLDVGAAFSCSSLVLCGLVGLI